MSDSRELMRTLIQAGAHYGHKASRWFPKMAPYIWGQKNNIHLIDVSITARQLERAGRFLEEVASQGKTILWVGTKKPAQDIIRSTAARLNMPCVVHRWIGGTLSNFGQVKKSVTKLLHFTDVIARAEKFPLYTKKELNVLQKSAARLDKNVGLIRNLSWPIGALVLIDVSKERSALKEAVQMGNIPVVALVDTNSDPSMVDYVIPGNDDAPRAIQVIVDELARAVERGLATAAARPTNEQGQHENEERPDLALLQQEEEDAQARGQKTDGRRRRPEGQSETARVARPAGRRPITSRGAK